MFDQILTIVQFIIEAFLHIWPYLLITIPLAVAVQMSGASKYINRAFQARPITAIFLATAVGAFSPFCSCGVIPVVATLLIGGVPLAPVMAFWIASPSMDPEIFFLSVATIGWELAVWRLIGTLVLSLGAGFITYYVMQQGWLGESILRTYQPVTVRSSWTLVKQSWHNLKQGLSLSPLLGIMPGQTGLMAETACCSPTKIASADNWQPAAATPVASSGAVALPQVSTKSTASTGCDNSCNSAGQSTTGSSCGVKPASFRRRLLAETWTATAMVIKFMALAFFLEALIILYIPSEWIVGLLGQQNSLSVLWAALIGVPVYTSNLAALPMVSGLLAQGMNPGAGLAFLIAGPTTTLPAMAAVWGLTTRRVFTLYVMFSLVGAIVLGYTYSLVFMGG